MSEEDFWCAVLATGSRLLSGAAFLWCVFLSFHTWRLLMLHDSLFRILHCSMYLPLLVHYLFLFNFSFLSPASLFQKSCSAKPPSFSESSPLPSSSSCSFALVCLGSQINILFFLNFSSGIFIFFWTKCSELFQRNSEQISSWRVLYILCEFQTMSLLYAGRMTQSFV